MKKILLAITVAILTAAFTMNAQAAPKSFSNKAVQNHNFVTPAKNITVNKVNHNLQTVNKGVFQTSNMKKLNPAKVANYHLQFGTKFSNGYLYKGKHHNHWSYSCWAPSYGCNIFYDPCLLVWFYWCEPDLCYYPVTFCPYRTYCRWSAVIVTPTVVCDTCQPATVVPSVVQMQTAAPPLNEALSTDAPLIPAPVVVTPNP